MTQIQNSPVYELGNVYLSGLKISYASTTVIAIAPGQARDANNIIDMPVGYVNLQGFTNPALQYLNYMPPLLVSTLVNGPNGLDTGAIAASTQYAIFLIGDSRGYNQVAGLLSLTSNAAPIMPLGYDSFRLLGFAATDSSKHFVYATNKPQNISAILPYYLSPSISVLSGGTSTTFAAIDLTTNSALPTTTLENIILGIQVTYTPAAANNVLQFRPTGSSATANLPTIIGVAAGIAQTQYVVMIAGVGSNKPEIDYIVTASDTVSVSVVYWAGISNTAYPALV